MTTLNNFHKHFSNITKTNKGRSTFNNFLLTPDYWYATDNHRAIRVENTSALAGNALINPSTMQDISGGAAIPTIDFLFKSTPPSVHATIKPSELEMAILNAQPKASTLKLVFDEYRATLTNEDDITIMSFSLYSPIELTDNDDRTLGIKKKAITLYIFVLVTLLTYLTLLSIPTNMTLILLLPLT